jgi:lysophospholipase L1-like esterase
MSLSSFIKIILSMTVVCTVGYTQTLHIMPLGDSITYDNNKEDLSNPRSKDQRTAYRSHLWYMLQEAGWDVNFVGSQVAGLGVTPAFDADNEGHPDWTSYDIANSVYKFLSANHADTVLLHIGTNDRSTSIAGVNRILDEIDRYERDKGVNVRVLVAMIIPRTGVANVTIDGFNSNLVNLVAQRINQGDMLTLVDQYRGAGLVASDYADITHPNDTGYAKMATVWFNALQEPYDVALHSYPRSIAPAENIGSVSADEEGGEITFLSTIPDSGITF